MGPFTDPYYMLVDSAQPWNVDTVMVDGRILKRSGKLTAIDTGMLMAEAPRASREARDRAKWWQLDLVVLALRLWTRQAAHAGDLAAC